MGNFIGPSSFSLDGGILQVVSAHKTTVQDISGTSFVQITGVTPSITPLSTSSKILILVSINFGTGTDTFPAFRLYRGATVIGQAVDLSPGTATTFAQANATGGASPTTQMTVANYNYVDSPSTTSSTTYSVYVRPMSTASRTVNVGDSNSRGDDNQYTGTSHITLLEIGG